MTTSTVPSLIDADPHVVERAEPALLDEQRDAGADQLAGGAALQRVSRGSCGQSTAASALSSSPA